jgi:hypothetical protein
MSCYLHANVIIMLTAESSWSVIHVKQDCSCLCEVAWDAGMRSKEVTGAKLCNVSVKPRRMGWAVHVICMGRMRNVHKTCWKDWSRQASCKMCRLMGNIKMDLKEMGHEDVHSIHLTGNYMGHTSLFRQKLCSPNRFSRPLIIIFSTKGFLTVTTVLPFSCTPHEVPLKTGVISVYDRVQCDHTLGRTWSADGSVVYASVRNRPKTDAVWP